MLIPQQIYDLDTITLQQKTQELIKKITIAGQNCPKHLHQTLQLAKLQIQQRRSIEQFGLNLQQQIKKFDQFCLYPEKQILLKTEKLIPDLNTINSSTTTSERKSTKNLSNIMKYRIPQRSILQLLKNTKIQTEKFIIGKSSIQNLNPTKRKTILTPKRNLSSEKNLKKLPSIKNLQKYKKSQPKIKEKNIIGQSRKNIISNPIQPQFLPISHQNNKNNKSPETKKRIPVKNNIKFIQNDFYSSSEEQIQIQQTAKIQQKQIVGNDTKDSSKNLEIVDQTILLFKKSQDQISQNIQNDQPKNQDKTQMPVNKIITENKQQSIQKIQNTQKIPIIQSQPIYVDKIDYFRLTVPHKKHEIKQQQLVQKVNQQQDKQNIQLKQQQQIYNNKNDLKQSSIKQNQINIDQFKQVQIQKVEKVQNKQNLIKICPIQHDSTIQITKNQSKLQTNIFKIKTRSIIIKNPYKNMLLQKILIQLPPIVTQYHEIIPQFANLFHSQVQPITLLRQLSQMMKQHFETVHPSIHFVPNLCKNTQQFQNFLYKNNNKIRLYGNQVDLNLSNFELKDEISRLRSNNQIQIPKQQNILYYRVIKTKQQVYDIISSTFNRTQNWAQLPHGMNLKSTWNLLWTWAKPQIDFKKLIYFQKVNHFPHNKHLSRKDMLKKNIQKIKRLGIKAQTLFDIIPQSFLLPGENTLFIEKFLYYKDKQGINNLWIMKPIGQSRGRGISLINNLDQILYSQPVVLQKYLKNPLLLDGYKFDMRIYVLLTSINPLEVFVYKQGFARLSTQKYNLNINDLSNNFIHLTNFAIQRQNYVSNGFSLGGTKISLKMLKEKLKELNIDWKIIWNQIIQIILKSNIAAMNQIPSNQNCFQLFGYDIIIDDSCKCWLLQINSSPSLQRQFILDQIIKQQLIDDTIDLLNIVKFDRKRLLQVFQRRILQYQGRKSVINTQNNSILQLNRDLHYILHGQTLRKYGEISSSTGNFEMIAPSDLYYNIVKIIQNYKITNIIKK